MQIGVKGTRRLKIIRSALLKSAWFSDTTGKLARLSEKAVGKVLKDDGKFLLPSVSAEDDEKEMNKNFRIVRAQVGVEAKSALKEHLGLNVIPGDHKFFVIQDNVFAA